MTNLPIIAQATPTLMTAWPRLFPDLSLTADDQFLIELNSVFSTSKEFASGYGNHPRHYQFDQRIPFETMPMDQLTTTQDINDIVESRAKEILARNQLVKIFWSGGIDSTLTAASILSQLCSPDQVQVYYTCESIRENPYFFDHIASHNVKTVMWSDHWAVPFDSNDLIVTGTSSDEITGSLDQSFYDSYCDQLTAPWKQSFQQLGFSHLIERCEELFARSHSPVETLFDARWWFYFYIRHTHYARRDWHLNLENDFASNTVQFFNTPAFDAWSVANKSTLIGNEYRDYKMSFKQATAKFWNNQDYVANKEKENSFISPMWISKKVIALGNQHLFIYRDAAGHYKKFAPSQLPFVSKQQVLELLNEC